MSFPHPAPAFSPGPEAGLLEAVREVVWTAGPEGALDYLSPWTYTYTGLRPADLFGAGWQAVVHPEDAGLARAAWERLVKAGAANAVELRLRRHDGSYRWHACRAVPQLDGQGGVVRWVGTCTDVDALMLERQRREALVQAERDILERIARCGELPETLAAIVEMVESQTAGALASILLLDAEDRLHVIAAPSLPPLYNQAVDGVLIGPKVGSCGTAAFLKATVVTADIATDPLWEDYRQLALSHGLASSWSTPLMSSDGRVLGTLAHYYRKAQDPTPHDLHLTEIARHLAVIAIERKQAEVALREGKQELERRVEQRTAELLQKERRFRALFDHAAFALGLFDLEGRPLEVNPAYEALLGYGAAELRAMTFLEYTHPEDREPEWRLYQELASGQRNAYQLEKRFVCKDGRTIDARLTRSLVRDAEGQPNFAIGMIEDVSDRKRAEENLRTSETLLRAVVDHSPDAIYIKDLTGRYLLANQACATNLGHAIDQVTGHMMEDLTAAHSAREIRVHDEATLASGTMHTFKECLEVSGEERIFLSTKFPWRSETGALLGLVGISRDITAQVQRERVLTAAQGLAHLGSWEWDVQRNQVHWSDELYRIYGVDPASFGATFEAFLACIRPDERERVRGVITQAMASHGSYDLEEHIVRPSGEERVLVSSGRVDVNEAGKPVRLWGICLDITERKRAEEEVHKLNATLEKRVEERTRQLEAANRELEAFSYSVSHDLRAPLRGIDGFSRILLDEHAAGLDETGRDYLRRVRAAGQRMGQLIDDILELSRLTRGELRHGRVDLSAIATEIVDELRAMAPAREVVVTIAPGLVVEGDARLLRVALDNLLRNAWKFTSKHASARIAFGVEERGGTPTFFVRDDGAGFDMAHVGSLFKPFSRLHTASEFEGTGVGLATVQRAVHRHGGRIWAEAAVEGGATFFFTLHEGPSV